MPPRKAKTADSAAAEPPSTPRRSARNSGKQEGAVSTATTTTTKSTGARGGTIAKTTKASPAKASKRKASVEVTDDAVKKARVDTTKASSMAKQRSAGKASKSEEWWDEICGDEKERLTAMTLGPLFESIDISLEGPGYLVLAYAIAKEGHQVALFDIPETSFMLYMKQNRVQGNADLRKHFGSLFDRYHPGRDSSTFSEFFKWVFTHVKAPESKIIPLQEAIAYLTTILDSARYSISWSAPSTEVEDPLSHIAYGDPPFPHLRAFIQFLGVQRSIRSFNRDQWDSFLPFNQTVKWDLDGYDELGGGWPYVYDEYVGWHKDKFGSDKENKDEDKGDESWMDK